MCISFHSYFALFYSFRNHDLKISFSPQILLILQIIEFYSIFIYHSIIIYLPKFYLFLKPSKRILFPFSFIIIPLLFFALPTSKSWSENTFHPNSIYFFIPSKGTSYVLSKCISKSIVFFQRKDTRIFRTLSMDTKRTRVQLPSLRDNEITRKKIKHSKPSVSNVHVK